MAAPSEPAPVQPLAQRPPLRSVALVAAPERPHALAAVARAAHWLREHGVEARLDGDTAAALGQPGLADDALMAAVDLVIVVGGDGTVVAAARRASGHDTPVIGVNFGTFGFLAEIDAEHLEDGLAAVVAGRYDIESRLMLAAEVLRPTEQAATTLAANDIVVKASDPSRILDLRVHRDGHLLAEFPADGLILSTPTGSTAYNLSAGGPVVEPMLDVLLLTPICPHTLATRPLVLDASARLHIEVVRMPRMCPSALVSVDGQMTLELDPGGLLEVRRADRRLRLARLRPTVFYDSLRGKLRWGKPK